MIVIALGPERPIDPEVDDLGRRRVGYSPSMSEAAVYEANHGTWKLGPRAVDEQYALLTFEGTVVQAIEIDRVERVAETVPGREGSSRSVIHGKVLQPGGRVYDAYVDQPSPVPPGRNPVRYYDEP